MENETCREADCAKAVKYIGLCEAHYKRARRSGALPLQRRANGYQAAWIHENVSFGGEECLIWPFYRQPNGYGTVRWGGKTRRVIRVMCELAHGPEPVEGAVVAHSCECGRHGCVNPKHLRWATHQENMKEATLNRRMRGPKKISDDDVERLRELRSTMTLRELSQIFGIAQSTVSEICSGKRRRTSDSP